jgi:Domain of unknown function (DUF5615)
MDFLSANEAKLEGVPDPDVLALAGELDRILVTHDRQTMPGHFAEFLMSGRSCPGVFLVSQHAPIGEVMNRALNRGNFRSRENRLQHCSYAFCRSLGISNRFVS